MTLPIHQVSRPAVLDGKANGKLPDSILRSVPGQEGGPTVRLVEPAARAWTALCSAARREGHILKATSASDSFRPYTDQERIFRARYQLTPIAGADRRTWQGRVWFKKHGVAAAAVPGTSNHGWGLAVDTGTELDGDAGTESIDKATLNWLLENAERFGFSWELQSEPWHIRYFMGDKLPSAVLLYEHEAAQPDIDNEEENDDMLAGFDKNPEDVARAMIREYCNTHWGPGKMLVADQNWLLGEWQKNGREYMMTKLLDHPKAKKIA